MKDELRKILEAKLTGEQYDELHGTFIRIPFTKQMDGAADAILELFNKQLPKEKTYEVSGSLGRGLRTQLLNVSNSGYNQCLADIRRATGLEDTE